MFMQFYQFWFLRFAFVLAMILIAFVISRCLAWIMNVKYRSLPVLGWLMQRGTPLHMENLPVRKSKRCIKISKGIPPTFPSPLRGGGVGWGGKTHQW